MLDLAGKSVLITAAATRTGAGLARYLLGCGAEVFLGYRKNRSGIDEILAEFPQARPAQGDVTDPAQVERMRAQVERERGRLFALINVVGDWHQAPILETSYEEFRSVIANNLDSVFLLSKAFYPLLKAQGNARIINFAYAYGERVASAEAFAYHIAKLGLISLTKSLAKQWGQDQISANVISPGHLFNTIVTEAGDPCDSIPQGRLGTYEDLYCLLDLLLRDESAYLTGSNLIVSGGYNL